MSQRAMRWILIAASYLVVATFVLGAMWALLYVRNSLLWPYAIMALLLAHFFTLEFADTNRIGLHHFYRGRIARCFLGAARARRSVHDTLTETTRRDDLRIHKLPHGDGLGFGPLHLVVCAANDLSPRDPLVGLSRGAESAVLSPVAFSVGRCWATWPSRRAPTLAAALTASGAAFNTQMGAHSSSLGPAVGFIMTTLGLRLGLWLRHPKQFVETESIEVRRVGFSFFRELLGRSDANRDRAVFLSDGGHFDNTGVYELVRRHCRYILVSDCGADSVRAFDDLGTVVRRVREDFGVDIRINLDALRPNENGRSRQPMVAGDIHYPDGDTGVLLIIKPTITGSEPPDILQYHARNGVFPHQSTADQFFDEAQWESYRRLGLHAVRSAFSPSSVTVGAASVATSQDERIAVGNRMRDTFNRARREWLARPADFAQRVDRLARVMGALDATMRSAGATLQRQLYWELGNAPTATSRNGNSNESSNAEDTLSAITALRQGLVAFESIFLSESLATEYNQPMYTGVINVMARWFRAPMMIGWWPLLKSTCSEPFRRFVETHFLERTFTPGETSGRSPNAVPSVTSGTNLDAHQVAAFADAVPVIDWELRTSPEDAVPLASRSRPIRTAPPSLTRHLLQRIEGSASSPIKFEAARLDADITVENLDTVIWTPATSSPPGLWGMGIGTRFLASSVQHAAEGGLLRGAPVCLREQSFWSGTPDAKKAHRPAQTRRPVLACASDLTEGGSTAARMIRTRWGTDAPYL
ncbi:MAG: hypothetical protein U0841_35285 [Chloroflexia bacterium]